MILAVSTNLPVLLLDVDGVLNPYAAPTCPPGFREVEFFPGEEPIRLCADHGPWIHALARRFEVVWATGWEDEANRLLSPALGIPQLPVVRFPTAPFAPSQKVPAISRFVAGRPAVWLDDVLTPEAWAWAAGREEETLLIEVDPARGLTRSCVARALRWSMDHRSARRKPTG